MDWRHNQWIGVIAAVAVVLGIVGVFMYLTGSGAVRDTGGYPYRCESLQQTFNVSDREMESSEGLREWGEPTNLANLKCKLCDNKDAVRVYYCATCQKWYQYTPAQVASGGGGQIRCPEGHET